MSTSVRVHPEKDCIALIVDGRRVADFTVGVARAVCDAMRPHVRGDATGETNVTMGAMQIAFRTEPALPDEMHAKVVCIGNGRLLFDAPIPFAVQIWKALSAKQRELEEVQPANVERVAFDGGLLLRTGAPFGLTDNPRIQDEVVKEAGHNRDLRRALPGGILGNVLSAPRIINDTRTPQERLLQMANRNPETRRRLLAALH